jgi:DNA-binding CsgD family transcriptional regulator
MQQLIGRDAETTQLRQLVAGLKEGTSGAIVLLGEAGVGKTTLLDALAAEAADARVVRVTGIESEMEFGYAGLHSLLAPFVDRLDALPEAQRTALGSAIGLLGTEPPDRFLVGLATLSLLSELGADRPILCIVDDAQWLDSETLGVVAFVARRLEIDPVAIVVALRELSERTRALDVLPSLNLAGLDRPAASTLLEEVAPFNIDEQVRARLIAETRGNPMALIEIGAELSADELAGRSPLPEIFRLGPRLEERFARQVAALPRDTETFLLVAAAEPTENIGLVLSAAARLGVEIGAAEPAEAAGLIGLQNGVRFRHPLIRAAAYHVASELDRRRAHEALAEVSDADADADRRAWHRAATVVGVDDDIAADLEGAADRAHARGGYGAEAAVLTRAAQLTSDADARNRRQLRAAQALLAVGSLAQANALVEEVAPQLDGVERAQALRLQGTIRFALGDSAGTVPVLLRAAWAFEPFSARAARDTLLDAYSAAIYSAEFAAGGGATEVARAARAIPRADIEATAGDLLLDALATLTLDGHAVAAPQLRAAIESVDDLRDAGEQTLRWLGFACLAAGTMGDNEKLRRLGTTLVERARRAGAQVALARGLYFLAMGEIVAGAIASASDQFAEGRAIMTARGDPTSAGEVVSNAWLGREEQALADFAIVDRAALQAGQAGAVHAVAQYALGVLDLAIGRTDAALAHARAARDEDAYGYFLGGAVLPDLVEAAVRAGDGDTAAAALAQLSERAAVNQTHLDLGLLARSQALIADRADAERLYETAIEHLELADARGQLARAHLVFGEWLSRERRRREAIAHLRRAIELFTAIGAQAFAKRANDALSPTGEGGTVSADDGRDELTSHEERIARLAARGATNAEIASRLFISASTVDYHLRKVYRKLGVASRRELSRTSLAQP